MAGNYQVILGGSVTNPAGLPIDYDDTFLNAGSLCLLDPTHTARAWPSGVPVPGASAVVPNIAWQPSLALGIGSQQSDVDPALTVGASLAGTVGKIERTTKGGIHVIASATLADGSAAKSAKIDFTTALKTYFLANTGHSFYFSAWEQYTRSNVSGNQDTDFVVSDSSTATANYLVLACGNTDRPTITTLLGGHAPTYPVPVGNLYRNRAMSGWIGTVPAIGNLLAGYRFGATGFNATGANASGYASKILYRLYVEDLTVSGRTYAQVDALDSALYAAAVTTSGGKYNADTFTNPTTIP